MKFLSTALLLLSTVACVEGKKNPHGFDPGFLKAMNQGAKKVGYLKEVTNYERKQFWKKLLTKAKPASEAQSLRSKAKSKETSDGSKSEGSKKSERKLEQNYGQYGGQQNYQNNANNNQNQNGDAYQGYNYGDGNSYYYAGNNQQQDAAEQEENYNYDAESHNYNGNYNYGDNDAQYNYNGGMNAQQYYNQQYYEGQDEQGIDWTNMGFDMTQYSLKYTGCSAVKTYNSERAEDGWSDSVLSTKRFALFRLCPTNNCNRYSVNGCGRNYGEYVLEMDAFLEGVVEFNRQRYWHYCHFCRRCNGLESYGERMSELSEDQMDYYEQMQAEAEAYYESQQEQYQQENQDYAQENAANYNYYYNQNGNEGNGGNNQYNYQANNNGDAQDGDDAAADENNYAQNGDGYWKNGNFYYNNQYQRNNNNGGNNNNANNNDNNGGNGRRVRKLMVPDLKVKRQMRELYNNYYNPNGGGNQNAQYYYYQQKKQEQYADEDGGMSYEDYQEYMQNMNENMYNPYYWDEDLYGEWDDDWSETWLAFNWQVLPYCSESEVTTCQNAEETCGDYDDDYDENAENEDGMGGFSACTQIDDNIYLGPHCNADGYTITLGVYADEYCDEYIGDQVNIYEVLGYDIDEEFDFFPQECVTCEEGGEEREFASFMEANQDFDNYEEWLDSRWEEYIEYVEEQYQENMGEEQAQYYYQQAQYYQAQNFQDGDQENYYYANGHQQQQGGGNYYYGNAQQQQQYAQYGGQQYQNQQMAEQYGNYGAQVLNQGMNFYYNRGAAGDWITNEQYDAENWAEEQEEQYGDYYYYKKQQQSFAKSGVADVCGALYTYSAKCNKHLTQNNNNYGQDNMFDYSYGSSNQELNEETVCNFIDNLQTQKYDEWGDVVLDQSQIKTGYVIDFAGTNWRDVDQVKAQAEKSGVTVGQAVGLAITMAACLVMAVWACCLHSTLARKNIPWRPKRGKLTEPTDINRQNSGIVMGRSRSGMSGKNAPLI